MPNENSRNEPASDSKDILPLVKDEPMGEASDASTNNSKEDTKTLAKEAHWIQHATFWSQVGLGIIGIFALLIYYCQLKQMTKATDAAKNSAITAHDALVRSNRPWIGMDSAKAIDNPTSDETNGVVWIHAKIEAVMKNFGVSPALSVRIFSYAYTSKVGPVVPQGELRIQNERSCLLADGNEITKDNTLYGMAIFPNQPITYTVQGNDVSQRKMTNGDEFQWVGCISYRDQFDERTRHTHFCFVRHIGRSGPLDNCQTISGAD